MAQGTAPPPPDWRLPIQALGAGALACVALYAVMKAVTVFDLPAGRYGKLGISLAIFFAGGMLIGRRIQREGSAQAWRLAATGFGAALIGIAAGVIFWNGLEDLVLSRISGFPIYQERRMFPLDVALLWMFGSIPIAAGIATGLLRGIEQSPSAPSSR